MATFFSIVNGALARLGQPPIEFYAAPGEVSIEGLRDFDTGEDFPGATGPATFLQAAAAFDPEDDLHSVVSSVYPGVRDALLAEYSWSWLTTRLVLQARPERMDEADQTSLFPWPYPNRWARPRILVGNLRTVWNVSTGEPVADDRWLLQQEYIFTDFAPAYADYQGDTGEPAYPALFVLAMELQLASALAYPLTQDNDAETGYARQAMAALEKAKRVDAQSQPSKVIPDMSFEWVEAHIGGGGRRL